MITLADMGWPEAVAMCAGFVCLAVIACCVAVYAMTTEVVREERRPERWDGLWRFETKTTTTQKPDEDETT